MPVLADYYFTCIAELRRMPAFCTDLDTGHWSNRCTKQEMRPAVAAYYLKYIAKLGHNPLREDADGIAVLERTGHQKA